MQLIQIDDFNYHTNRLSQKEQSWSFQTYCRVASHYKKLPIFIDKTLEQLHLSAEQKTKLLTDITSAFAHYAKVTIAPKTETELDAYIKKCYTTFLPYIVKNVSSIRSSHPIQYEPIALTNIYISNLLKTRLENIATTYEGDKFESCFLNEFIACMRTLRSLLFLLTIGDDVHGAALMRGAVELMAKLNLADKFQDEYVLFKEFNIYLQDFKINRTPLPKEMTDYLKNEKGFDKNRENFLAYSWVKNKSGKRISNMKELVSEATNGGDGFSELLQISSEFVHEDYIWVRYDYIALRKSLTNFCFSVYQLLFDNETSADKIIPESAMRKVAHLLSLANPYYFV